jgi:signal transduction histidine kinase
MSKSANGIHINKQRWKIFLALMVLIVIAVSLLLSNSFVSKIAEREKSKATQWVEAIQKKGELVQLSNAIFSELKRKEKQKIDLVVEAQKILLTKSDLSKNQDVEFSLAIIQSNTEIPVVLLTQENTVMQHRNMDSLFSGAFSSLEQDSICTFKAKEWKEAGQYQRIEYLDGEFLQFVFGNSFELERLQRESKRLISLFNDEIKDNKALIPVMLWDVSSDTLEASNLSLSERQSKLLRREWMLDNMPLTFDFGTGKKRLYFSDSDELLYLQWIPTIQFLVLGLLILLGYFIFSTYRKAEQKRVWAGMAKETAHQLGTPLSSLMGWQAHLENLKVDSMVTNEMKKDLVRLERITDRFSKIGSEAKLEQTDISNTIENNLEYLRARLSNKVELTFHSSLTQDKSVAHNAALMDWVIENLCKNAVDAMQGDGKLEVHIYKEKTNIAIDFIDSGKGVSAKDQKAIFEPGFSTKKRGWGLGLALVKRIIEEHHSGKVFVSSSKIGKGTTFRILLPTN